MLKCPIDINHRAFFMAEKLTDKQEMFCKEYLIDLNATQAAIRAGYSEKSAYSIGQENLNKPEIQNKIQSLKSEREKRLVIDADWVLKRAVEINNRCMQHEPVIVAGEHLQDENGNNVYKFDSSGANKSLELIGKHVNIQAWKEKQEITLGGTVTPWDSINAGVTGSK